MTSRLPHEGPDLWTPDVRTPAPSQAGSASSQAAATMVSDPMRRRSFRLIFAALAAHGMQSREQLSQTTGLKESSLCGRLTELSPVWVTVTDGVIVASSGCHVNGYSLSPSGWNRWKKANEPQTSFSLGAA